jgi:hypothetical protein
MGTYIKIYNNAKKIHVLKFIVYLFLCSFLFSFFCYIKEGVGGEGEGKGTGLFKFIASFNLQRFLRSSTLPRYYPFGLSKSRNNSSLINLLHRGKLASGQNPYVISASWLFRRINPPTPGKKDGAQRIHSCP